LLPLRKSSSAGLEERSFNSFPVASGAWDEVYVFFDHKLSILSQLLLCSLLSFRRPTPMLPSLSILSQLLHV
jgi:hypothetical protein